MPHLLVHPPDRPPFTVALRDGVTLGRHEQSDVVLADAKASRRHAVIARTAEGFAISDSGSTHGTFVNGERVQTRLLADGDRVQIGEVVLTFSLGGVASEVLHRQPTRPAPPSGDGGDGGDAAARLRVFYDVAAAVGAIDDADALLARMLAAGVAVLRCERGVVALVEPGGIRRVVHAPGGDAVIAEEIAAAILSRKESVIVREPRRAGGGDRVLSAMGVPLVAGTKVLGLLYVEDRGREGRFTEDDLAFLDALGHLTAAALESAARFQQVARGGAEDAEIALSAIAGQSDAVAALRAQIRRYAAAAAHVLVHGESGTGKELVARALHALSPRADRPFVTLNCAAIPETMIESELFGHERGAFTGALKDKKGKFALAHRGTLFLDEIGDLGAAAQAKLLRAIQEGEVQPVGAEKTTRVDVRVVTATHKDLAGEVRAGRFREDLFYRLAVVELSVPPLRDRGDDVLLLAHAFVTAAAARLGKPIAGFSPASVARLRAHRWPGNVRELINECERAAILTEGPLIEPEALGARVRAAAPLSPSPSPSPSNPAPPSPAPPPAPEGALAARFAQLEPTERALVEEALAQARGNISEAARLLGISRIMMRRRVDRFGLTARDEGG